jgi:preprotein translocase subunit SecA
MRAIDKRNEEKKNDKEKLRTTKNDEENTHNEQEARNKFKRSAATNKERFGFGYFCRFFVVFTLRNDWTFLLDTFALISCSIHERHMQQFPALTSPKLQSPMLNTQSAKLPTAE